MNKKGKMTWEYLIALLLILVVVLLTLLMLSSVRTFIVDNVKEMFSSMLNLFGV